MATTTEDRKMKTYKHVELIRENDEYVLTNLFTFEQARFDSPGEAEQSAEEWEKRLDAFFNEFTCRTCNVTYLDRWAYEEHNRQWHGAGHRQ